MRLAALRSLVNANPAGLSGYPRPARRHEFLARPLALLSAPSPELLRVRVHPPVSFASSSEYDRLETCPSHECAERLPWGPASPSRHEQWRSTCGRGSTPDLRSALGVSHALDGFRPPLPRGLVSSHNHVRDSPSRGFPHHPAGPPRRRAVPSCRWPPIPVAGYPSTPAPMPSPSGP